ncbi:MAG TPA: Rnf-Nqr domain containing protein, partial [Candidatus Marinimicrobia bacterium]|nr:Rnf-Nqr domain containing protein [Candidatus Neomarinimicrobiota bacterium]
GYSLILLIVASIRELFGAGKLLGVTILRVNTEGGWYVPNGLLVLPASAFFLIGLIIWGLHTLKPETKQE